MVKFCHELPKSEDLNTLSELFPEWVVAIYNSFSEFKEIHNVFVLLKVKLTSIHESPPSSDFHNFPFLCVTKMISGLLRDISIP